MATHKDSNLLEYFLFAAAVAASAAVLAAAVDRAAVSRNDAAKADLIGGPRAALIQSPHDQVVIPTR